MTISPMLAKQYVDYQDKIRYPVYSQPKLDGIRCIFTLGGAWSRNGNPILSVPHINYLLYPLFKHHPDLVLDGELYCPNSANFPELCSLVKRTNLTDTDLAKSAKNVAYYCFDIFSPANPTLVFTDRHASMVEVVTDVVPHLAPIHCLPYTICQDKAEVDSQYDYLSAVYEGQMIRLDMPYDQKRSRYLLKRKKEDTDRFFIVGVEEGLGKWNGMAGCLVLVTKDSKRFTAALAMDDTQRQHWWDNKASLPGRWADVKFQYYTPNGVPRHPRVTAIH